MTVGGLLACLLAWAGSWRHAGGVAGVFAGIGEFVECRCVGGLLAGGGRRIAGTEKLPEQLLHRVPIVRRSRK